MVSDSKVKSTLEFNGGSMWTWPLFFLAWFWIIGVCLLADVPYGWSAIPIFVGAFILRSVKREEWHLITYLALFCSFLFFFIKVLS